MIAHRLAAIALAASLVHLNAVRADVACGRHTQADSAPQAVDHTAHHGGHAGGGETVTPTSDSSCETPAQTDCCQALVSCSPTIGADLEGLVAIVGPSRMGAMFAPIDIPHSRVATPDPPPPRA